MASAVSVEEQPMPGRRIVVVGVSGAGKTTVAKALAERLGIRYICNDAIIWRGNWVQTPPEVELAEFDAATADEAWTLDGNLNLKSEADRLVLSRADTLVWLDPPRRQVWSQLLVRTVRRAWTREELWHGNRESWRVSFFSRDSVLWWSIKTYRSVRRRYSPWMTDPRFGHLIRIRLTSRPQVNAWLDRFGPRRNTSLD